MEGPDTNRTGVTTDNSDAEYKTNDEHAGARRMYANQQAGRPMAHDQGYSPRVTVQDLEGEAHLVLVLHVQGSLDELRREIGRRFQYKSERCRLYTKFGAPMDALTLLRDDDFLFATDGSEFPQSLRDTNCPGLENYHNRPVIERYDVWGWPRIGHLCGPAGVATKLHRSWRHNTQTSGFLLMLSFIAFLFPPSGYGRGICGANGDPTHPDDQNMRLYFWFFGMAIVFNVLSMLLATILSMQLNLLATHPDTFWFLKEYGNWLVGWPTTFLVIGIGCFTGGVVNFSFLIYEKDDDSWIFLGIVVTCAALLMALFLSMSTRSWRRVNGADIRKIWPGEMIDEHAGPPSGFHPMNSRGSIGTTDMYTGGGYLNSPTMSVADDKSMASKH